MMLPLPPKRRILKETLKGRKNYLRSDESLAGMFRAVIEKIFYTPDWDFAWRVPFILMECLYVEAGTSKPFFDRYLTRCVFIINCNDAIFLNDEITDGAHKILAAVFIKMNMNKLSDLFDNKEGFKYNLFKGFLQKNLHGTAICNILKFLQPRPVLFISNYREGIRFDGRYLADKNYHDLIETQIFNYKTEMRNNPKEKPKEESKEDFENWKKNLKSKPSLLEAIIFNDKHNEVLEIEDNNPKRQHLLNDIEKIMKSNKINIRKNFLWKMFIDRKRISASTNGLSTYSADLYDDGTRDGINYMESLYKAFFSSLSEPRFSYLNLRHIDNLSALHQLAFSGPSNWSTYDYFINSAAVLAKNPSDSLSYSPFLYDNLLNTKNKLGITGKEYLYIKSIPITEVIFFLDYRNNKNVLHLITEISYPNFSRIKTIYDSLYKIFISEIYSIKYRNDKDIIKAIIKFTSTLEICHFFSNGNTRLCSMILLNSLLIQFGLKPCVLALVNGFAFDVIVACRLSQNLDDQVMQVYEGQEWFGKHIVC